MNYLHERKLRYYQLTRILSTKNLNKLIQIIEIRYIIGFKGIFICTTSIIMKWELENNCADANIIKLLIIHILIIFYIRFRVLVKFRIIFLIRFRVLVIFRIIFYIRFRVLVIFRIFLFTRFRVLGIFRMIFYIRFRVLVIF